MDVAELDALQAQINGLRDRLAKPTATKTSPESVTASPSLLVLRRRRSWTLAPLVMAAVMAVGAELVVFAATGHGFVNALPVFFIVAWSPWTTGGGELCVRDDGIVIPGSGGVVLAWKDMERVERRRWARVPLLHFDVVVGSSTRVYAKTREVVIPLSPYVLDWRVGAFGEFLLEKRPQLLSG